MHTKTFNGFGAGATCIRKAKVQYTLPDEHFSSPEFFN